MTGHGRFLRRRAVRVALVSTVAVLALLVATLAITDVIVARNLTAGIDDQLRDRMSNALLSTGIPSSRVSPDGDFDEPVLAWIVTPAGTVEADAGVPGLPASLDSVSGPTTVGFAGGSFRFAGALRPDGSRLVVAESLYPVDHAITTLLVTEGIASPVILLVVLAGAYVVGQRVAGPVERMRQRQLAFTADASHELRTPLAVIRAETSLAREGTDVEARAALVKVDAEAERMRRIVDDLLWLARFQDEPSTDERSVVDLGAVADVAVARFTAVAQRRSIALEAAPRSNAAVRILAAPDWIDHAVGVLLDNACRYTPVGGCVTVEAVVRDGRSELAVNDTGRGVPANDIPHLFDRYRRATSDGEGAGLGLAIADAIVRATDGRWDVSNRPGGGARFAISWAAVDQRLT